jgi:hypothetical protein
MYTTADKAMQMLRDTTEDITSYFYWLGVMVSTGDLTCSEAGYIVSRYYIGK